MRVNTEAPQTVFRLMVARSIAEAGLAGAVTIAQADRIADHLLHRLVSQEASWLTAQLATAAQTEMAIPAPARRFAAGVGTSADEILQLALNGYSVRVGGQVVKAYIEQDATVPPEEANEA